jgi:hypothetical protein
MLVLLDSDTVKNSGISKINNYVGDIRNQTFDMRMKYRSKTEGNKLKLSSSKFSLELL